ncbi:zinc finger, CCHC-type containing protein [Tanacetum coccineum]
MSGDKNENNKVVYREVATPLQSYQCPVLNNTNFGNGRQGIGNQTQGRGKYRSEGYTSDESDGTDNKPRRNGDKSQINCYKCGKLGHYAYECPSKKKEEVEGLLVENDDEPALLMCLIDEN